MKLKLQNLQKFFKKQVVIKDLSFVIKTGDVIGFIGDNGAGKTTTIKLLLGEYKLTAGDIFIDDRAITLNDYKKIAFFPDQNSFPRDITINDYFNFYLNLKGIKLDKNYRDLLLTEFGLTNYLYKPINKLSSGMIKKMLMIAVLLSDCDFIIFDEPTANLDINSRNEFIAIFKYLKAKGKTLLITTHLVNDLELIINRLIIIKTGTIVYDKPFNKSDNIEDIYKYNYSENFKKSIIKYLK
ncbi:ABC transporter ATP-binding protein [Spiroplasma syrphidicola EA-1]|uniref:ABC transporter ATP-binding protein n=1 Tax=Spiroplasma syrphidicola EA-1 TaxID=1276229 RepID=R4UEM1_9MOLU|nr:ABC transporter ATP-binding protein [Spiroplasma syrphidicola]AGM26374.1 ABC transporter ATP-binding protein [Spiroplasma syrphidicola EA-1]